MRGTGLIEFEAAIAVAKHRNFRLAAAEMGMSPSSIGSTIRALEARIGVQLFNRTTRSVALTSAGEAFINRVSSSVADIAEAIGAARGHSDQPRGVLRINSSVTACHEILSPLIAAYLERYPEMQIDLVTDQRLIDIVLQGFDAGIRMTASVPGDMIAVPLGFSLDFSVVGSPSYFSRNPAPKTPHDLVRHRCIRSHLAGGGIYRWEFDSNGQALNIDVPGHLILDEQSLILKAAIAGLGVAYLADTFTREAVAAGQLKYVLRDYHAKPAPLSLYYPRNRHTPAALRAFVALIRTQARDPALARIARSTRSKRVRD